jgi:hypothetical protein
MINSYQIEYWTKKVALYEFLRKWDEVDYAKYRLEEAKKPESIWNETR